MGEIVTNDVAQYIAQYVVPEGSWPAKYRGFSKKSIPSQGGGDPEIMYEHKWEVFVGEKSYKETCLSKLVYTEKNRLGQIIRVLAGKKLADQEGVDLDSLIGKTAVLVFKEKGDGVRTKISDVLQYHTGVQTIRIYTDGPAQAV